MRLTSSSRSARLGRVRIRSLQKVIELDSGSSCCRSPTALEGEVVTPASVCSVTAQMAIVVPCMDEELATIEGVLSGIPHDSLVILVSNSRRDTGPGTEKDSYAREAEALQRFCRASRRSALAVHQRDPGLASAFRCAGMRELVDDAGTGLIWSGKGEAMLVGTALAAAAGRRYVGFIDADNFVPGSVREYCEAFAAGLHLAQSGRGRGMAMVRLSWRSKPKVRNGKLEFNREGRSSRVTNRWLNKLLAARGAAPEDTDIMATGNAGEHAMSLELAMKMRFASGFAVEPFQILDMLEQFGSSTTKSTPSTPNTYTEKSPAYSEKSHHYFHTSHHHDHAHAHVWRSMASGRLSPGELTQQHRQQLVEVLQIETRNPHFHQDKGDEHVRDMWAQALGVIHGSSVTPSTLRQQIAAFMSEHKASLPSEAGQKQQRVYPPLETVDLSRLWDVLCSDASSLSLFGDPLAGASDAGGAESSLGVVTMLENVRECICRVIRSLLPRSSGRGSSGGSAMSSTGDKGGLREGVIEMTQH